MKYSKSDIARAYSVIENYRGKPISARVNSVSRSGMSRRIEYYTTNEDGSIARIGYYIAIIADYPYSVDKGGIRADGCGMDMVFNTLSNFNYAMAKHDTGKTILELLKTGECGEHIYDKYFFNANNIRSL